LARIRSAGVTDLRFGNVRGEDWRDRDRFAPRRDSREPPPLPEGGRCFAGAGTLGEPGGGALAGDGPGPGDSAPGRHARPERALAFPPERCFIAGRTGHLDLLASAAVREVLERWLASPGQVG